MNADNTTDNGKDVLCKQFALLDQLVTWEQELEVLKELEADLEAEQISTEVVLRAATSKHGIAISPDDARAVAKARARKRELEAELEGKWAKSAPSDADMRTEIERMRTGREALEAWRDAPKTVSAWRRPRLANTVLVIACAAAVAAAVALHPVYLALLVPLVMAIGYFTFTAQDAEWVRLGAVRRFQNTRLKPPSSWQRDAVDGRIHELNNSATEMERRLSEHQANRDEASAREDDAASEVALSMQLVEAAEAYEAALAKTGLDAEAIDDDLSAWLDLVLETHYIDGELDQLRTKRGSLSREAEETRDALFRFLALSDQAPPEGRADSEALRAGLKRVAESSCGT